MTEGRRSPDSSDASQGWAVLGTLLAGICVWGGVGWLLDLWWGTEFVKAIGVIVGATASVYYVTMRFGRQ
jgi:F0F1-type ATP synthase assembly protein I